MNKNDYKGTSLQTKFEVTKKIFILKKAFQLQLVFIYTTLINASKKLLPSNQLI